MTYEERAKWILKWGTAPFWIPAIGVLYVVGAIIGRLKEYEGAQKK
jgi:hypothetical protein